MAVKEAREPPTAQMDRRTQEEVVEVREDFRPHWLVARADRVL